MGNNEKLIKPPFGLLPKYYHERNVKIKRFSEICDAISDYYNKGLKINISWVEEYNELVGETKQYYDEERLQKKDK